jgi:hypothetical protein
MIIVILLGLLLIPIILFGLKWSEDNWWFHGLFNRERKSRSTLDIVSKLEGKLPDIDFKELKELAKTKGEPEGRKYFGG